MTKTVVAPRTKTKTKTQRPPLYKVILLNDDYTPREFVVLVLKAVFRMSGDQAYRVMMTAHQRGACVIAVYTRDVAETKAKEAHRTRQKQRLSAVLHNRAGRIIGRKFRPDSRLPRRRDRRLRLLRRDDVVGGEPHWRLIGISEEETADGHAGKKYRGDSKHQNAVWRRALSIAMQLLVQKFLIVSGHTISPPRRVFCVPASHSR